MRSLLVLLPIILFLNLSVADPAIADIRLAAIFSDNMVFQRDQEVRVFGWGDPGNKVNVALRDQQVTTTVGDNGRWIARLEPIGLGDPFEVSVKGDHNAVKLSNCLAGEVWICSGQSNMEWWVHSSKNPKQEIAAANFPLIRHCDVTNRISIKPEQDVVTTGWTVCTPDTVGNYTAVGYYFARYLHQQLSDGETNVPIGLINTTWGGTIVEAWTSGDSLENHPDFKDRIAAIRDPSINKEAIEQAQQKIDQWEQRYRETIAENSDTWKQRELDVSAWDEITAPELWESQGYEGYDGIAWYRKVVTIPESWAGKEATLSLARIDDEDTTYVNGKRIGQTRGYNDLRSYKIPAELVTAGEMSIAICVVDSGFGGGIHGEETEMSLSQPGVEPIQLSGKWKFKTSDVLKELGPRPKSLGFDQPNNPTALHNAMVNGLVPFSFQGAIWYQGESNANRAYQYRSLFPLLIKDWRSKWNREFPFYWVQLANFRVAKDQPGPSDWAELREAQSMTLSLAKTGEAVTIDIGEAKDIHPKNKQDVGMRLALHALAKQYGQDVVYSGPRYTEMAVEGSNIRLTFAHVGSGLVARGDSLQQFQIAGKDRKFVWAEARIEGSHVLVTAKTVADPVAVRYAWSDNPEGCNLYNKEGLPASPFRTDDWPGVTQK